MSKDVKVGGKVGPIRSPMSDYLTNRGTLRPPTGANTTIPGSAPKAAPIRSPLQGMPLKDVKTK
jgi:hypothetical protein